MQKFARVTGVAAVLNKDNIDTDAIIPVSWMRSPDSDLGRGLFGNWRYDANGNEVSDFVLNWPNRRNSRFIVAGANFGCGSSREAAVWALARFGVRCVIAPSFSDIFLENSFKNGLLPVTLPAPDVKWLVDSLSVSMDSVLTVDLEKCIVEVPGSRSISFSLPPTRRIALLERLDEISTTLRQVADVDAYQRRDEAERPWIHLRRERE